MTLHPLLPPTPRSIDAIRLQKTPSARPWLALFALLGAILLPTLSHAEIHPIDAAMEKAQAKDPSTAGQTSAIDSALKKWDTELNRHYDTLLKRLDPEATAKLRESQREWVTWRDKELESLSAFFSKMDGTMWVPASAYARMNITRERALSLGRLAELSEMRENETSSAEPSGPDESWLEKEQIGSLRLDQPAAEVLKRVGSAPVKGKDELWAATGDWIQSWTWKKLGLKIDMASTEEGGKKQVRSITVTAPSNLKTTRGAGIGTPEAEVRRRYADVADPDSRGEKDSFVAGSVYGGVIFTFRGGRVSRIFMGAAAE